MYTTCIEESARAALLIVCLAALVACGGGHGQPGAQPESPPPAAYRYRVPPQLADGWSVASADSKGLSTTALESIVGDVRDGRMPIVDAVAVARGGQLVFAETLRTRLHQADKRVSNTSLDVHVQNSASKSFASALVGIAVDQGLIDGVEVPYLSLFPYPGYANDDARKRAMRLEDVLSMRLGLAYDEWTPPYSDPDNQMFAFYRRQTDFSKGLLDLPMATDPGSEFAYVTPAAVSLGQAVENAAPLSLIDFSISHLFGPLQIERVEVETTPTGLPDLGRGLFLSTRDLLKLGQLFLDSGVWKGQRLVSSDWVSKSTTSYTDIGWANPENLEWHLEGYGYQWWIGSFDVDGERIDTFAAWGFGEQWLMVIPTYDLVVAVNSHGQAGNEEEANQALGIIKRVVLATQA